MEDDYSSENQEPVILPFQNPPPSASADDDVTSSDCDVTSADCDVTAANYDVTSAAVNHRANVDTSRPFRSVKEAVAIFGERFLAGEVYAQPPSKPQFAFPKHETQRYYSPARNSRGGVSPAPPQAAAAEDESAAVVAHALSKLEAELEETKAELKKLRERESETEIAVASLNAELHKNMSKLAQAEAASAGKAAAQADARSAQEIIKKPSLEEILRLGERKKKTNNNNKKKKPIIPLVGDLFNRKKGSSSPIAMNNPLFSSSHSHSWFN